MLAEEYQKRPGAGPYLPELALVTSFRTWQCCFRAAGRWPRRYRSGHANTKHAVKGLTKNAAVEFGKKNIPVNAVCPAVVDTEMFHRAKVSDPKKAEMAVLVHPVGRVGQVEEIAATVLYLCSDSAGFTTCIGLPVDGCLTAC